ncbi:hypothetical protein DY000_02032065 [Brassica cretica]|uniref:Uncharacterized protein n=1 Tax=Brassica cretica TaxID=69181 RepID=A0ABQ7DHI9_BRACR|nr:hypothetical protein DY000_02032065 [Brassica cretica]
MTATERRKQRRRDASSASRHAHRTPLFVLLSKRIRKHSSLNKAAQSKVNSSKKKPTQILICGSSYFFFASEEHSFFSEAGGTELASPVGQAGFAP